MSWMQGDYDEATREHERARAMFAALGDEAGVAWSTHCLATQAVLRSDFVLAASLARDVLASPVVETEPSIRANALVLLGVLAWYQDDPVTATRSQEQALTIFRRTGDAWRAVAPLTNLADIAEATKNYEHAASLLGEALRIGRTMHNRGGSVMCVESVAELLLRGGEPSRAARLFGACSAWRSERVLPLDDHEQSVLDAIVAATREAAGAQAFELAWTEGARLPFDEVLDEAILAVS
jgi:hypothetical protein